MEKTPNKQLQLDTKPSPANKYMTVKYMGVVEGQFGVLSTKVVMNEDMQHLKMNASTVSGKNVGERLLKSLRPDERKMKRFSTPMLKQKDISKSVLFSDR